MSQGFNSRRQFYSDLHQETKGSESSTSEETKTIAEDELLTPSKKVTSSPTRGSLTGRTFKAFTLQLAENKSSPSIVQSSTTYYPYLRPESFQPTRWIHLLTTPLENESCSRCICIHGIGGSPIDFIPWKSRFESSAVELYAVCLPARHTRCLEPSMPIIQHIAHAVIDAMTDLKLFSFCNSLSFYGHSIGSLIAFECIRVLLSQHSNTLPPLHLFISSCPNPISLSNLNSDPFISKVSEYSNRRLYELLVTESWWTEDILRRINCTFMTLFRSDLKLYENYIIQLPNETSLGGVLKNVPLTAFEIKSDDSVALFSEDYYVLQNSSFEYSWDRISSHVDTIYVKQSNVDPYYFIKETAIVNAILSFHLSFQY